MTKISHNKKLSADARIVLGLIWAKKPMTYADLAREAGVHRATVYRVMPLLLEKGIAERCSSKIYLRTNYPLKKECFKIGANFGLEKMGLWWFRETARVLEEQYMKKRYEEGKRAR